MTEERKTSDCKTITLKKTELNESDLNIAKKNAKKSGGKFTKDQAEDARFAAINMKNAEDFIIEVQKSLLEINHVLVAELKNLSSNTVSAQLNIKAVTKEEVKIIKEQIDNAQKPKSKILTPEKKPIEILKK